MFLFWKLKRGSYTEIIQHHVSCINVKEEIVGGLRESIRHLLIHPGLVWVGSKFVTRDRCYRTWPDH